MNILKHLLRSLVYAKKRKNLNSFASIGSDLKFNRQSSISTKDGASVNIGSNVMMYGVITADCGGKVDIGDYTSIREGCKLFCANSIKIEEYVIFADNIIVSDTNHHPAHPDDRLKMIKSGWSSDLWGWKHAKSDPIVIKRNVWIGQYSRILKGVTIGENSIVASNSVVTKDVPPNCIVAGNPAKVVKTDIHLDERLFD